MPKLDELRQKRGNLVAELEKLAAPKTDDGSDADWTDDHQKAFDTKEAEIKAIDDEIADMTKAEAAAEDRRKKVAAAKAATATPVPQDGPTLPVAQAAQAAVRISDEQKALAPVRVLMASLMYRHDRSDPEKWLDLAYGPDIAGHVKATHQLTDFATGGALSLPDFAASIVDGLNNMTVVRRMNPQVLPVPGALILPTETSAPDGSWLTENEASSVGNFAFGDIRIDPKRLALDVVISRRLLDQAANGGTAVRALEGYIVRRMRERMAVNEDYGFLRGAGTQKTPLGIRNQIAAGNVVASTGATASAIETDLRGLITTLEEANIMIQDGHWIMPPRTRAALADLRDANGNKIYPSIDNNNTLLGYPIQKTNQIPINLSGSNTEIMFGDGPSIIIANSADAAVTVSTEGSYQDGANHRSLIQRNEMLIHMETYSDVKLERADAWSALTGVSY